LQRIHLQQQGFNVCPVKWAQVGEKTVSEVAGFDVVALHQAGGKAVVAQKSILTAGRADETEYKQAQYDHGFWVNRHGLIDILIMIFIV